MVDRWLKAINEGKIIGTVMVDFKKAFDLVDHDILLKKLVHYKLSSHTLAWVSSYLLERQQRVSINNTLSDSSNITNGVPQGCILCPLLFLIFINDLPLYTNEVFTDLYADDTTLYNTDSSPARTN